MSSRPQDLIVAFSNGDDARQQRLRRRHRRLGLPRQRQRPVRRRPVRPRHRRGRDSSAEANNGGRPGTCPNCTVVPLRVGDSFVADVEPIRPGRHLRHRQRRAGHPGGARHAQQVVARPEGDRLRLQPRRGGDRLGRRRGRPAPQLALDVRAHDRRELREAVRLDLLARQAVVPPVQRLHQLLDEGHARDTELELLVERHGRRGRDGRHRLQRRPQRERQRPLGARPELHADERPALRDHRERGEAADGVRDHHARGPERERTDRHAAPAWPGRRHQLHAPGRLLVPAFAHARLHGSEPALRDRRPRAPLRQPRSCAAIPRTRASTSSTAMGA